MALPSSFCDRPRSKSRVGLAEQPRRSARLAAPCAACGCRHPARARPGYRQLRPRGPAASEVPTPRLSVISLAAGLAREAPAGCLQSVRHERKRSLAPSKVLVRVPDGARAGRIQPIGEQHGVCGPGAFIK